MSSDDDGRHHGMDASARPATSETTLPTLDAYARHTAYSDPGPHAGLLAAIEPDPASIGAAARAAVVHYRDANLSPTADQREDPDRRWLSSILDAAAERQPGPLDAARDPGAQVAGCCRDHTLFALGVLREHDVPARSRIGFAGYFSPPFWHDHVVVEHLERSPDGERWVRWDAELTPGDPWSFDVRDMPTGTDSPFRTAAEAWRAIRSGGADAASYGVDPGMPHLCGKGFVREYVLLEVAHRMRDELLLWDLWGPMLGGDGPGLGELVEQAGIAVPQLDECAFDGLADELAALLVAADGGDAAAEATLAARYTDTLLRPGARVVTTSPSGRGGVTDLRARRTEWLAGTPSL
jgi:hypothetical protein